MVFSIPTLPVFSSDEHGKFYKFTNVIYSMGFFKKGHIIVLLINIAVACIVLFLIGYIVLNRLEKYTNHGYYITVPELRGLTPDEAEPFAKEKNLQILVIDSIYDNNAKPGTIVEQFPSPNAHVKNNRPFN